MTKTHRDRPCPYCRANSADRLDRYCRDVWDVVSCDNCGFVYLSNPVEYAELEETYSWDKTYVTEDSDRAKSRGVLKRLARNIRIWNYNRRGNIQKYYSKFLGKGGKILDIGCADRIRFGAPFIPFGIEISKSLAKAGDEKMRAAGGSCVHASGADGVWAFEENFFDCAILHSYLEHETEVTRVLEGLHRCLKPGGKAFIRVPNFNSFNRYLAQSKWPGFRYPDHVNYFTRKSLSEFARRAGFEFSLVNRANLWIDDNIKAVISKPIKVET